MIRISADMFNVIADDRQDEGRTPYPGSLIWKMNINLCSYPNGA